MTRLKGLWQPCVLHEVGGFTIGHDIPSVGSFILHASLLCGCIPIRNSLSDGPDLGFHGVKIGVELLVRFSWANPFRAVNTIIVIDWYLNKWLIWIPQLGYSLLYVSQMWDVNNFNCTESSSAVVKLDFEWNFTIRTIFTLPSFSLNQNRMFRQPYVANITVKNTLMLKKRPNNIRTFRIRRG